MKTPAANLANRADKLLRILSQVMLEDGADKATDLYLKFRKLDTTLRDRLYPALNRIGLGEGPDVVRFGRQMLERVETACRFPELTNKPVVKLMPPFISDAFNGKSLGLIGRIPEIGTVRTIIPILALHGPRLKIEYVNYADCRREISVADYGDLIRMSQQSGLWLNRLIKNFIFTSPEVTPWAAVLVVADRYANVSFAERLSMYIGQTFPVLKMEGEPKLNPLSSYLGLREQFDWLLIQVRSGLLRDEQAAKRINHAVTEDRTRLMSSSENASDFFAQYQKEAKSVIGSCKEHLDELGQILREAEIYLEDIRHLLHDVYSVNQEDGRRRFKRLPCCGKKGQNLVTWCLCRIIETYVRSGFDPREWYGRLDKFGIPRTDRAVVEAVENGRRMANESFIDSDELVKEGERKIKARTSPNPLKPTDVQLVPYKMAAAFGNVTALSRLADIFYKGGRYSHGRRLKIQEEIDEAKALRYVLGKLVHKNIDVSINRDRIERIRVCLGEYDRVEDDLPSEEEDWIGQMPSGRPLTMDEQMERWEKLQETELSEVFAPKRRKPKKNGSSGSMAYDENASYESTSVCTSHTSSGCFVVTAATRALRVGRIETAKAFLLMRRLKDQRMMADERGRILLSAYYRAASQLVAELDKHPDAIEIYGNIWRDYIQQACDAARLGDYVSAECIYTAMVERLLFAPLDDFKVCVRVRGV